MRELNNLAKNRKPGVEAAEVGDILERWKSGVKLVAHDVGLGDEVELTIGEAMIGDGEGADAVVVFCFGTESNYCRGVELISTKKEPISGADVLVKLADRKADFWRGEVESAGVKFGRNLEVEVVFEKHVMDGPFAGECSRGGGRGKVFAVMSIVVFEMRADRDRGVGGGGKSEKVFNTIFGKKVV